jgi:hypothetical protein
MNLSFNPKRVLVIIWVTLFPMFFVLWYAPYVDTLNRACTLAVVALIFAGSIFVVWRFRFFRWILLAIYAALTAFLILPSKPPEDRSELRASYCRALTSYTGCPYVWGGVGYFGIDCSGLVQKSLEDALVTNGLSTLNPFLIRESAWLYWNRTTAKVLGQGNIGRTYSVTTCPNLNSLDYSGLVPGDLAVTATGEHVMAYLGNKTWIAADDTEEKVTKFTIPVVGGNDHYFEVPMKIVRWKVLSN